MNLEFIPSPVCVRSAFLLPLTTVRFHERVRATVFEFWSNIPK